MRVLVPIFLFCVLFSCVNDDIIGSKGLTGKWIVVKDSLEWSGHGVSHMQSDSDYFNFKNTGVVIIKEGAKFDTAHFSHLNNQVAIFFEGANVLTTDPSVNLGIKGVDRLSGYYGEVFSFDAIVLRAKREVPQPPIVEGPDPLLTFTAVISLRRF